MEKLDASAVAKLLTELGQRVELSGDSPYKARAYHRAAESLRALTEPLEDIVTAGRVREIPGVGAAIEDKIIALHRTGTHTTLERLREEVPAAALDLLRIPGLTAAKARKIVDDLKIGSVEDLDEAVRQDRLRDVKGLGPALQQKVAEGIGIMRRGRGQRLLHHAADLLDAVAANLHKTHPELEEIVPAGDVRRGCELVADLAVMGRLASMPEEIRTVAVSDEVELYAAPPDLYGPGLILATGSEAHVRQLAAFAEERGFSLDTRGLRKEGKLVRCREEADVYTALGLQFIPPELREGTDEIALAAENRLPKLVEAADIRGLLHSHTTRSDGLHDLETMAEAARDRGYGYFGVADHSQSAGYAGGLTVAEIEAQHTEADALNRRYRGRFRILKGIESDILPDGSLDYPDDILARFDFVVASIHSRFRMDKEAQTQRLIRAVENPYTTILGHMTGRLLLRREGYPLDVERVLRACAANGVAVEINANPHRLDVDWRWHRRALELGCMLSINPDAHSTSELDLMRWGLMVARKGGVPKERVLNCLDLKGLTDFLKARKKRT